MAPFLKQGYVKEQRADTFTTFTRIRVRDRIPRHHPR